MGPFVVKVGRRQLLAVEKFIRAGIYTLLVIFAVNREFVLSVQKTPDYSCVDRMANIGDTACQEKSFTTDSTNVHESDVYRDFAEEAAIFQEKGFALVTGLFNETFLFSHLATVRKGMSKGGKIGFRNPWKNGSKEFKIAAAELSAYPEIAPLLKSKILKHAAAALLGVSPQRLCLVVDKIFEKQSGDDGTHWHTDAGATEVKSSVEALTAWIPFQNMTRNNGLLRFGVGSHIDTHISSKRDRTLHRSDDLKRMAVGDVSFHHIRTHHSSYPNLSNQSREAVTIIFAAIPQLYNLSEGSQVSCSPYWMCPFALYGSAVPRTKSLCRECDPYFPPNEFHHQPPSSRPSGWLDRCTDEIVASCADIFSLPVEGLSKKIQKWIHDAKEECGKLKAWVYEPLHENIATIPNPRESVYAHLIEQTSENKGFWRYDMILGEGDSNKDKSLSIEEFLNLPFFRSETFQEITSQDIANENGFEPPNSTSWKYTTEKQLVEIFQEYDSNGDKVLDIHEFKKLPIFKVPLEERNQNPEVGRPPTQPMNLVEQQNHEFIGLELDTRTTNDTSITLAGETKTPIVILENVLPKKSFYELRDFLRNRTDFFEGDSNSVAFPGKIAKLDWRIVDMILKVLLNDNKLDTVFSHDIFRQKEHVRAFASILCNKGWVHNDFFDASHKTIVPPAAVFYFGFPKFSADRTTGTAFFREAETGFERTFGLNLTNKTQEAAFCKEHPKSVGCQRLNLTEHNARFEEIARVDAKPNRMILYPHDIFHNAFAEYKTGDNALESSTADLLPCSVERGRLAISMFFLVPSGSEAIKIVSELSKQQEIEWRVKALRILQGHKESMKGPHRSTGPVPFKVEDTAPSAHTLSSDTSLRSSESAETSESEKSRRPYPFGIFDLKLLGKIDHELSLEPTEEPKSELCCAKNYSAAWDLNGKLVAVVIDNFFCQDDYRRLQYAMHDSEQWSWENVSAAYMRLNSAEHSPLAPSLDFRSDEDARDGFPFRFQKDSPSLLGKAKDAVTEQKIKENINKCLRQTLPKNIFKSATNLICTDFYGAVAFMDPDDMSPSQSAPHVGPSHFASEYTVTSKRKFQKCGTVFVEQKGSGIFNTQTEPQRVTFNANNRNMQRVAVEDLGEPIVSGWMNASNTRWGFPAFMVPNQGNRILLYPQGRPHNDYMPDRDCLSSEPFGGRMLLKSFWMMAASNDMN